MDQFEVESKLKEALAEASVSPSKIEHRSFPGEHWLVTYVPAEQLAAAQSMAGEVEQTLNGLLPEPDQHLYIVNFRPVHPTSDSTSVVRRGGNLFSGDVDQLIQLLEARSRTSDALPSLRYVEDPRGNLTAIAATRHHLIFGRRGVGKTALMLEAKRSAEKRGHATVWLNAQVLRNLSGPEVFRHLAGATLRAVVAQAGTSKSPSFQAIETELASLDDLTTAEFSETDADAMRVRVNSLLRPVLREGLLRLYLFIDDFYFLRLDEQALALDLLAGSLRDCDAWLKVASIAQLTRPFEPSARIGLEIPHDATAIDLDVTLEDPSAAQQFLESLIGVYTESVRIPNLRKIAKPEALGRLVLASGGVPRDYLTLFASSIVTARENRDLAREIGKEDVAIAAGKSAARKIADLEQDVSSDQSNQLIVALDDLRGRVKGDGYVFFRVNLSQNRSVGYSILSRLVDLRFVHLIQRSLSDQHKAGVRYEAFILDLSQFSDVRLHRGLNVLDLVEGGWTLRRTGRAGSAARLSASGLRDSLRSSPLVDVDTLG